MPSAPPVQPTPVCRQEIVGRVFSNSRLCREHYRIEISVPAFPATDPGQFIQIACRDVAEPQDGREIDWQPDVRPDFQDPDFLFPLAVLRRPFSLAGRRDTPDSVILVVIHRVVGMGTAWLERLVPGDSVSVLGPLGNRFMLPPENGVALLVGGGVGIPPMLYLAERLASSATRRRGVAFCGATTKNLLPLTITNAAAAPAPDDCEALLNIAEFAAHGLPAVITTDDGSYGFRGFVTQALERYLDRHFAGGDSVRPTLYTCGPELMMKRVADIAARRGLECQIAVERAMACGMGTCQSCVIKVKSADYSGGWRYRLACTDGPVFSGSELLW